MALPLRHFCFKTEVLCVQIVIVETEKTQDVNIFAVKFGLKLSGDLWDKLWILRGCTCCVLEHMNYGFIMLCLLVFFHRLWSNI